MKHLILIVLVPDVLQPQTVVRLLVTWEALSLWIIIFADVFPLNLSRVLRTSAFLCCPKFVTVRYANAFSGFQSWPALFCIWWFLWRGIPFSLRPKLPNSIGALQINFQKILQSRHLPGRAANSQAAIKERRAEAVQDGAVGLRWPEFSAKPFNIPIAVEHLPYPLLYWIPDDGISLPYPSNVSV